MNINEEEMINSMMKTLNGNMCNKNKSLINSQSLEYAIAG